MKIYISYPRTEHGFVADLAGVLRKRGYEVFFDDDIPVGADWSKVLSEKIAEADAIIVVYSGNVRPGQAREVLYSQASQKLIIPVVIGNDSEVPYDISRIQGIYVNSTKQFDDIKQQVLLALNTYSAQAKEEAKADKEAQELLQKGINSHIEGVLDRLKTLEKRQKIYAGILYALSAIVLLLTIIVAIIFLARTDFSSVAVETVAIVGVTYLLIAVLIISFSKFLFTLAKSFMVEAIRCSDRIHAISFGKFYIDAFDEKVTREEVIKIFSTWNIDNGATIFRNQSSDDYDPKLHELLGLLKKTEK